MPKKPRRVQPEPGPNQNVPSIWHLAPSKGEAAKKLVEWSDECILGNGPRASLVYFYGSAYEGYTLTNMSGFGVDVRNDLVLDSLEVPVYVNRIRALTQTHVAKTGANDNPVPQFVTNGAEYDQALAAETMGHVVTCEYDQEHGSFPDFHALCRKLQLMVDSCLGRGWVFVFPRCVNGRWKPEAELDDGLTVGVIREMQHGRIIRLCRSTWRDPEWLAAQYPDDREAIMKNIEFVQPELNSGSGVVPYSVSSRGLPTKRVVRLIQGWHCSQGEKDPGREMFVLKDGTVLCDNEWDRRKPPGAYIDFDEELSGEGGTSLTHTIYRMFVREQEMIHDWDNLERNTPMKVIGVQKGTGDASDVKKQLADAQGIKVIEVPGDPNTCVREIDLDGVPRKTTELMQFYAAAQHEIPGIARGHVDSAQPNHISSGIQASLEASLFPERHADFVMRFNRFRAVDCAELFVWAIQDIVADGESYELWAGDENVKRRIKGNELDLDMSKYVVQIKPSSDRKDSVATRLAKAEQWLQDPTIQFTGADMAQFWKTYDVDHFSDELSAITAGVRRQIAKWRSLPLNEAKASYLSPAKWMTIEGLQSALRTVVSDYEYARDSKVPQERLVLWENYMNQCVALIRTLRLEEAELMAQAQANVQQKQGAPSGGAAGATAVPAGGGGEPPGASAGAAGPG
jgi:hypothetical protein